jgi:hypothetical protein
VRESGLEVGDAASPGAPCLYQPRTIGLLCRDQEGNTSLEGRVRWREPPCLIQSDQRLARGVRIALARRELGTAPVGPLHSNKLVINACDVAQIAASPRETQKLHDKSSVSLGDAFVSHRRAQRMRVSTSAPIPIR